MINLPHTSLMEFRCKRGHGMGTLDLDTEQLLQLASEKLSQAIENSTPPDLTSQLTASLQRVLIHQRAISNAAKH